MIELWVEKYRPKTIDEYVWVNGDLLKQVKSWIQEKATPNLLLSGKPGTGKTSLAKMVLQEIGIPKSDIMEINASAERKIEDVQERIMNFAASWAYNDTGFRYVILDEADSLTPLSQRFLRAEIEKYHSTCRFIFTCNYKNKIIPALVGRLQEIDFGSLDKEQFIVRAGTILDAEGIEFDIEVLFKYTEATYPNLRKCILLLQERSVDGALLDFAGDTSGSKDYLLDMIGLFGQGKFLEARKLILSQAQAEEYNEVFRFFYENLDIWGDTEDKKDEALLIIRKGIVNHAIVADPEINLAAVMVELTRLAREE